MGPESFYSGGGTVIVVSDLDSARQALRLIADQGEGLDSGLYDASGELAHYYRFRQLQLGRYYQVGDHPDAPSGPLLSISWDDVYDVKVNARLADYPTGSELARVARDFNADYGAFLALLTKAFNGQPGVFEEAVWEMFRLRDAFNRLVCNPCRAATACTPLPLSRFRPRLGRIRRPHPVPHETTQAVTR